MRKLLCVMVALCIGLLAVGCGQGSDATTVATTEPTETQVQIDYGSLVILYTSDLCNTYDENLQQGYIGYGALAGLKQALLDIGRQVVLIDGGDSVEKTGDMIRSMESYLELVETVGYDYRVTGDRELSFGVEEVLDWSKTLKDTVYLSCNLHDTRTGETIFTAYDIVDYNGVKVAYLGITTPSAKVANKFYSLCDGDNGQELYDAVQQAIDEAKRNGADYVVAVGHIGTDPDDTPWTAAEIIANTTGISVFLDGHSQSVIEGSVVTDMDDHEVPVCAVGAHFCYVGQVELDLNSGEVTVTLLDSIDAENRQTRQAIDALTQALEEVPKETTDLVPAEE